MIDTKISWASKTWNPVTGCSKVSDGCKHCYAETLALKWGRSTKPWTERNAAVNVQLHSERLEQPLKLKGAHRIFVNSMSDLFHERIPDGFIDRVFAVMAETPWHTYQVLTKRPERMATYMTTPGRQTRVVQDTPEGARLDLFAYDGVWPPKNVWLGVSIESPRWLTRLALLRQVPAAVRFISFEPLIARIPAPIDLTGIGWAIVGGESGEGYRPMPHAWARELRDEALRQSVAFFFKQSAAHRTEVGTALEEADGSRWTWHQYPGDLQKPVRVRR